MHGVHYMPHDLQGKGFHARVTPMPEQVLIEIKPTKGILTSLQRRSIIVTNDKISLLRTFGSDDIPNTDRALLQMFRSEATQRAALFATLEKIEMGLAVPSVGAPDVMLQIPGLEPMAMQFITAAIESKVEEIGRMKLGFSDAPNGSKISVPAL